LQQFLQYYGYSALCEMRDWELLSGLRKKSKLPEVDRAEITGELYARHFDWLLRLCKARNWQTRLAEACDFATEALQKVLLRADGFRVDPLWSEAQKQARFYRWLTRVQERQFLTALAEEKSHREILAKYCNGPKPFSDQDDEKEDVEEIAEEQEEEESVPALPRLPPPAPPRELLDYLLEYEQAKKDAKEYAHVDLLLTSVQYEVLRPKKRKANSLKRPKAGSPKQQKTVRTPVEIEKDVLDNLCKTLNKTRGALKTLRHRLFREVEEYIRNRVRLAREGGFLLSLDEAWPRPAIEGDKEDVNREAI
jgi:DNA-directed RNA polymerase specialized sigma24 family protein